MMQEEELQRRNSLEFLLFTSPLPALLYQFLYSASLRLVGNSIGTTKGLESLVKDPLRDLLNGLIEKDWKEWYSSETQLCAQSIIFLCR